MYPYPVESDGQSLQGDLLYKGPFKAGVDAIPWVSCLIESGFKPEVRLLKKLGKGLSKVGSTWLLGSA